MRRDDFDISRRGFLKGMLAAGAAGVAWGVLPGSLLTARAEQLTRFNENDYQIFRNACPRNCYDTCSFKTYVKDGVVQFIEGSPESTFTDGSVCVKGYTYPRRLYSPDRIKYPMFQDGRNTGNWRRATWDEAMDRIAGKILEIKKKDGSLLGLGLTKYSGNFGITNYGVEGMMSSLGYTSRFVGTPCWPAGIDAQNYDLGDMWCNDPEDLVDAKYIIVWGANPAWCSMHSVKFLYEAKKRGAKLVVIDPVFTQTAAKADLFWQIKPGTDGALALGMARHLLDTDRVDHDFVNNYAQGYEEFAAYLRDNVTLEWASATSGLPVEEIKTVAEEFSAQKPSTIWIGYGMQRHTNGGAMVRAIDALVAMTGNIGLPGGGARYGHLRTWGFNYHAMIQSPPEGSVGFTGTSGPKGEFDFAGESASQYSDRSLNINKTAQEILDAKDPELKMLWVACKNPFAQDFDRNKLEKAFQKLELVVTADQFFTETARHSDIVLPISTLFEQYTVNVSYWHYWLALNEQAVKPLHEARSNIEIAAALSQAMNKKEPGSCTFPQEVDGKEWMIKEFNQDLCDFFGLKSWEDLRNGPAKARLKSSAAWSDRQFATPSGKYEFKSELCAQNGHKALPEFVEGRKAEKPESTPFRLMTPHVQFGLHSQFINLDWTRVYYPEPSVLINPKAAARKGIADGAMAKVFNQIGAVTARAQVTDNVPPDCLVIYEAWFGPGNSFNVQNVVDDCSSDMGAMKTGMPGVAIHDQFADITPA